MSARKKISYAKKGFLEQQNENIFLSRVNTAEYRHSVTLNTPPAVIFFSIIYHYKYINHEKSKSSYQHGYICVN